MSIDIELKMIFLGALAIFFAYLTVFSFGFSIIALAIGILGFVKARRTIGDKKYLFFAKVLNICGIVSSILLVMYYISAP